MPIWKPVNNYLGGFITPQAGPNLFDPLRLGADGRQSRFSPVDDEAWEGVKNVKPFEPLGSPSPAPQKFSKKKLPPVGKFLKSKIGEYENIDDVMDSKKKLSEDPMFKRVFTPGQLVDDVVRSMAAGGASGLSELAGIPRGLLQLPEKFTGKETVPDSLINMLPTGKGVRKAVGNLTGAELYKPLGPAGQLGFDISELLASWGLLAKPIVKATKGASTAIPWMQMGLD
jgi:hypothetical protein